MSNLESCWENAYDAIWIFIVAVGIVIVGGLWLLGKAVDRGWIRMPPLDSGFITRPRLQHPKSDGQPNIGPPVGRRSLGDRWEWFRRVARFRRRI